MQIIVALSRWSTSFRAGDEGAASNLFFGGESPRLRAVRKIPPEVPEIATAALRSHWLTTRDMRPGLELVCRERRDPKRRRARAGMQTTRGPLATGRGKRRGCLDSNCRPARREGKHHIAGPTADSLCEGAAERELVIAEGLARELGRISLADALELTILIAKKESRRLSKGVVRWLERAGADAQRSRSCGGSAQRARRRGTRRSDSRAAGARRIVLAVVPSAVVHRWLAIRRRALDQGTSPRSDTRHSEASRGE